MKTVDTTIRGKMYPEKTLFLRQSVGTAEDPDTGIEYELSLLNMMTPCIRSKKTGKWFEFSWEALIDAAKEAGIDKEDSEEQP